MAIEAAFSTVEISFEKFDSTSPPAVGLKESDREDLHMVEHLLPQSCEKLSLYPGPRAVAQGKAHRRRGCGADRQKQQQRRHSAAVATSDHGVGSGSAETEGTSPLNAISSAAAPPRSTKSGVRNGSKRRTQVFQFRSSGPGISRQTRASLPLYAATLSTPAGA